MKCLNCGIEFEGRTDAKYCSPKCRVTFSRKASIVTDNVTFKPSDVTDNFEFKVATYDLNMAQKNRQATEALRTAKYWYDVPLGAVPIIKKGWPEMPGYMNGRQYFLWWKNNFAVNDKEPPFDGPILHNPYPQSDKPIESIRAAEGSRRLGA